jgi:hypothetical protein
MPDSRVFNLEDLTVALRYKSEHIANKTACLIPKPSATQLYEIGVLFDEYHHYQLALEWYIKSQELGSIDALERITQLRFIKDKKISRSAEEFEERKASGRKEKSIDSREGGIDNKRAALYDSANKLFIEKHGLDINSSAAAEFFLIKSIIPSFELHKFERVSRTQGTGRHKLGALDEYQASYFSLYLDEMFALKLPPNTAVEFVHAFNQKYGSGSATIHCLKGLDKPNEYQEQYITIDRKIFFEVLSQLCNSDLAITTEERRIFTQQSSAEHLLRKLFEKPVSFYLREQMFASLKSRASVPEIDAVYNEIGHTPLMHSIQKKDVSLCMELLKLGADPCKYDKSNITTALHLSIKLFSVANRRSEESMCYMFDQKEAYCADILKPMLAYCKDVNIKDNDGNTPLHLAILNSCPIDFIDNLMEKGADLNIKNNQGETPLDLAIRKKSTEIMLLLKVKQCQKSVGVIEKSLANIELAVGSSLTFAHNGHDGNATSSSQQVETHTQPHGAKKQAKI